MRLLSLFSSSLIPCLFVLGFAVGANAQRYTVSPPQYGTKAGDLDPTFGSFPDLRYQMFDGTMRGKSYALKRVETRPHVKPTGYLAASYARKWQRVTLDVSTARLDKLTDVFSQNPTSTPTRVFDAGVAWPTLSGPATAPAAWRIGFSFQRQWLMDAKQDVCLDFHFAGGKLANGGTFGPQLPSYYFHDGWSTGIKKTVFESALGNTGQNGCVDSAHSQGGLVRGGLDHYGPAFVSKPNYLWFDLVGSRLAPRSVAYFTLGLRGSKTGWTVPSVACNRLFVDVTAAAWQFGAKADPIGRAVLRLGYQSKTPIPPGLPIYVQAGWADSKTKALRLTSAAYYEVPKIPGVEPRLMMDTPYPSRAKAKSPPHGRWNLIVRYTH